MRLFGPLYQRVLQWVAHRHAPWYLAALSFSEAAFSPIPPGVMLIPMTLSNRRKSWYYAVVTAVASAAGGVLGYAIGHFGFELVRPLLIKAGYWREYFQVKAWFGRWGVWMILFAGFIPVPYKLFTIAAGAVSMALAPFVLASLLGRGIRFSLTVGLIMWGGERLRRVLSSYTDAIGWTAAVIIVSAYVIIHHG